MSRLLEHKLSLSVPVAAGAEDHAAHYFSKGGWLSRQVGIFERFDTGFENRKHHSRNLANSESKIISIKGAQIEDLAI